MAYIVPHLFTSLYLTNLHDSTSAGTAIPLTTNEALSGIFGTICLTSWVFVLVPQLYENYVASSASGISILFLIIWLFGDVTNLVGSLLTHLVPTVIAIAIYFCFLDTVLISQVTWYEYWPAAWTRSKSIAGAAQADTSVDFGENDEERPLLGRRESVSSLGHPGSHKRRRRRSSAASRTSQNNVAEEERDGGFGITARSPRRSSLPKITEDLEPEENSSFMRACLINGGSLVAVCLIGTVAWYITYKAGLWTPAAPPEDSTPDDKGKHTSVPGLVLGYLSALAYLGARIPQIVKNWQAQSTEGLSPLFFMLSLMANLTYGAGILAHSLQKDYVLTNLPWLIGSLGTMVEDVTIFVQFRIYGDGKRKDGRLVLEDEQ